MFRLAVPIMVELLTQSKTTTPLADLSSLPAQLAQSDLGVRVDEGFPDPGLIDVQRRNLTFPLGNITESPSGYTPE